MRRLLLLLALACSCFSAALAGGVEIAGQPSQGGLVLGRTPPGAKLELDGKPVPVAADGRFLLGFGREAAAESRLDIHLPDGRRETLRLAVAARDWPVQRIDGLPEKQVSPDPQALERIRKENDLIAQARRKITATPFFASGLAQPADGPLSGVFGSQRILNGEPRQPHSGTDYAAPKGAPVGAASEGIVSFVHPDMFFTGKTLMIDHGLGLQSVYAHLDAILVKPGQKVAKGETVGRVGASGRATGPHLHLGFTWGEVRLDPEQVLALKPLL
jgi:murein DD-endopeptidase MepM/ murein hydrolase activator NlpD